MEEECTERSPRLVGPPRRRLLLVAFDDRIRVSLEFVFLELLLRREHPPANCALVILRIGLPHGPPFRTPTIGDEVLETNVPMIQTHFIEVDPKGMIKQRLLPDGGCAENRATSNPRRCPGPMPFGDGLGAHSDS